MPLERREGSSCEAAPDGRQREAYPLYVERAVEGAVPPQMGPSLRSSTSSWCRPGVCLAGGRVFVAQLLLPAEVVDHVGIAAVGTGGHDVVGRAHHARETLLDRAAFLSP